MLPFARSHFRYYLPLFPKAIESFDLDGYDAIISINHCVAKGVRHDKKTKHICYCLTPMRYVWVYQDEYFGRLRGAFKPLINYLKNWDEAASKGVDSFLAISDHVGKRIKRCYNRDSDVIFPPVDIGYFLNESPVNKEDYYLVVSELVPYKRTRLAIEAFNSLGLPLLVIGDGPCRRDLMKSAKKNISFLDWQPQDKLKEYYTKARALIYPQKEDFGITAVEAQAAGTPVIAYAKGGALDSVIDGETGIFFTEKSPHALADAVRRFNRMSFRREDLVENAKRFDKEIFKKRILGTFPKVPPFVHATS